MQTGKDDLFSIVNKYFPHQLKKSFTKRKKKKAAKYTHAEKWFVYILLNFNFL
jgi:hypothetical protein